MDAMPEAIDCLSRAIALDPKYREMAKTDAEFDAIRGEEYDVPRKLDRGLRESRCRKPSKITEIVRIMQRAGCEYNNLFQNLTNRRNREDNKSRERN